MTTAQTCQQAGTAALVRSLNADYVAIPGAIQYNRGALAEFMAVFDPTWGAFKDKTVPAPGNHEYYTPGGQQLTDEWTLQRLPIAYELSGEQMRAWCLFVSRVRDDTEPPVFNEPGLFLIKRDASVY